MLSSTSSGTVETTPGMIFHRFVVMIRYSSEEHIREYMKRKWIFIPVSYDYERILSFQWSCLERDSIESFFIMFSRSIKEYRRRMNEKSPFYFELVGILKTFLRFLVIEERNIFIGHQEGAIKVLLKIEEPIDVKPRPKKEKEEGEGEEEIMGTSQQEKEQQQQQEEEEEEEGDIIEEKPDDIVPDDYNISCSLNPTSREYEKSIMEILEENELIEDLFDEDLDPHFQSSSVHRRTFEKSILDVLILSASTCSLELRYLSTKHEKKLKFCDRIEKELVRFFENRSDGFKEKFINNFLKERCFYIPSNFNIGVCKFLSKLFTQHKKIEDFLKKYAFTPVFEEMLHHVEILDSEERRTCVRKVMWKIMIEKASKMNDRVFSSEIISRYIKKVLDSKDSQGNLFIHNLLKKIIVLERMVSSAVSSQRHVQEGSISPLYRLLFSLLEHFKVDLCEEFSLNRDFRTVEDLVGRVPLCYIVFHMDTIRHLHELNNNLNFDRTLLGFFKNISKTKNFDLYVEDKDNSNKPFLFNLIFFLKKPTVLEDRYKHLATPILDIFFRPDLGFQENRRWRGFSTGELVKYFLKSASPSTKLSHINSTNLSSDRRRVVEMEDSPKNKKKKEEEEEEEEEETEGEEIISDTIKSIEDDSIVMNLEFMKRLDKLLAMGEKNEKNKNSINHINRLDFLRFTPERVVLQNVILFVECYILDKDRTNRKKFIHKESLEIFEQAFEEIMEFRVKLHEDLESNIGEVLSSKYSLESEYENTYVKFHRFITMLFEKKQNVLKEDVWDMTYSFLSKKREEKFIKKKVFEDLRKRIESEKTRKATQTSKRGKTGKIWKTLTLLVGGSGSGKSTYRKKEMKEKYNVLVSSDEYKSYLKVNNSEDTSYNTHIESDIVKNNILREIKNLIIDHVVIESVRPSNMYLELQSYSREKFQVIAITTDLQKVIERIRKRDGNSYAGDETVIYGHKDSALKIRNLIWRMNNVQPNIEVLFNTELGDFQKILVKTCNFPELQIHNLERAVHYFNCEISFGGNRISVSEDHNEMKKKKKKKKSRITSNRSEDKFKFLFPIPEEKKYQQDIVSINMMKKNILSTFNVKQSHLGVEQKKLVNFLAKIVVEKMDEEKKYEEGSKKKKKNKNLVNVINTVLRVEILHKEVKLIDIMGRKYKMSEMKMGKEGVEFEKEKIFNELKEVLERLKK